MRTLIVASFAAALAFAGGTHVGNWSALESAYSPSLSNGDSLPLDRPYVSRSRSECLTDTDCDALADESALIGWDCAAPDGEEPYWGPGQPLYRDFEDEFPSTCGDIYAVHVVD